jgi:hypothetical protein
VISDVRSTKSNPTDQRGGQPMSPLADLPPCDPVAFPAFEGASVKELDVSTVPAFDDWIDVANIEAELAALPHLMADLRYVEPAGIERVYRSATAATAAETLGAIPGEGQAIHLVINGRFALWDFVGAILILAGEPIHIEQLHLATLGFSRKNIAQLADLLDAGKVGSVSLLCSHYFKGTSTPIYDFAAEQLSARGQRFLSIRTHAKVVLVKLSDGRLITLESSANLRSCKNIEQVVATGIPGLYRFHAAWMESLWPQSH